MRHNQEGTNPKIVKSMQIIKYAGERQWGESSFLALQHYWPMVFIIFLHSAWLYNSWGLGTIRSVNEQPRGNLQHGNIERKGKVLETVLGYTKQHQNTFNQNLRKNFSEPQSNQPFLAAHEISTLPPHLTLSK